MFVWLMCAVGGLILNPVTVFIGSLLPDADHRRAVMGRILPLWLVCTHRGITHSIYFLIVASVITGFLWSFNAGVGMAVGIFIHLMMDATTPSGIRWFKLNNRKSR